MRFNQRIEIFNLARVILLFLWIYAWGNCVNPLSIECFSYPEESDHIQHFLGWISYAYDDNSNLIPPTFSSWTWPYDSQLLFADTIPLLSIIFKPIIQLFNIKFHYFSLISLINILLIFNCVVKIGDYFNLRKIDTSILGFLLAFSPIAILRIYAGHESLSLHILIVYPLMLIITRNSNIWKWLIIYLAALGIHAYFIPIIALLNIYELWSSFIEKGYAINPKYRKLIAFILLIILGGVLFGYVPNSFSASKNGVLWSANVLALIDPQITSLIFPGIQNIPIIQWEGYSYLGLIGIFLIAITIFMWSRKIELIKVFPSQSFLLILTVFIFIIAIGNPIYFMDIELSKTNYILNLLGSYKYIFRATGRLMWPIYYILMIWSFINVSSYLRKRSNIHRIFIIFSIFLLLESHMYLTIKVNALMNKRSLLGLEYIKRQSNNDISFLIKENKYLINATGNPYFRTKDLPAYMIHSTNPKMKTNYLPRFARENIRFIKNYSLSQCQILDLIYKKIPNNELSKSIFILQDDITPKCNNKYKKILNLQEPGFSIYKIKDYGAFQTNLDDAA
ncbi:DUF6311 domain-containing protein [Prochlorococcus marinus]|uniref:DUF6311 domain-containing protein n=1 Tax=Prochlorococcus marinus XMU1408 TaxID=2213228 RepID=A0A318R347_PROMR|nr:DUF6311 domain-containing protein [Prochlorococcus marinus]MBW3042567.1 hypothetical protein [Prochlorococcus marinus str. XMU1408]PYE01290.1 hypothetical protein DNJ73_07720 [Prochlorococcus marinus XMU1408]